MEYFVYSDFRVSPQYIYTPSSCPWFATFRFISIDFDVSTCISTVCWVQHPLLILPATYCDDNLFLELISSAHSGKRIGCNCYPQSSRLCPQCVFWFSFCVHCRCVEGDCKYYWALYISIPLYCFSFLLVGDSFSQNSQRHRWRRCLFVFVFWALITMLCVIWPRIRN